MNFDEKTMGLLQRSRPYEADSVCFHHLSGVLAKYVLAAWNVKIGDRVRVRDIIAVVETADLRLEIEAIEEGVISELRYSLGDSIPDGAVIARLSTRDSSKADPAGT